MVVAKLGKRSFLVFLHRFNSVVVQRRTFSGTLCSRVDNNNKMTFSAFQDMVQDQKSKNIDTTKGKETTETIKNEEDLIPKNESKKEDLIPENVSKKENLTPAANPDLTYLLGPMNKSKIVHNLVSRNVVKGDTEAKKMLDNLHATKQASISNPSSENRENLVKAATRFPNTSHPSICDLTEPRTVFDNTAQWVFPGDPDKVRSFEEIAKVLAGVRTDNTGQANTEKSYFLLSQLAELEQALIRYTVDALTKRHGFNLVSVPDLLPPSVLEACGMVVEGPITQVFKLDPRFYGDVALSGTAEMSLGGLFMNKKVESVQKYAAVSRCYRAESTMGKTERGIYRVHHFTKVEMFALTPGDPELSNLVHEQFLDIQKRLFDDLGLYYRVLDMDPGDLGAPAARKFDCEAILPGRNKGGGQFFAEISSTSNCTDYQSRRLNIRQEKTGQYCHTINGTACAIPRMIMTICEQNQLANGLVTLPEKLWPYMPSMADSHDLVLEPRPRKNRPHFRYVKSPNFVADAIAKHSTRQAMLSVKKKFQSEESS